MPYQYTKWYNLFLYLKTILSWYTIIYPNGHVYSYLPIQACMYVMPTRLFLLSKATGPCIRVVKNMYNLRSGPIFGMHNRYKPIKYIGFKYEYIYYVCTFYIQQIKVMIISYWPLYIFSGNAPDTFWSFDNYKRNFVT